MSKKPKIKALCHVKWRVGYFFAIIIFAWFLVPARLFGAIGRSTLGSGQSFYVDTTNIQNTIDEKIYGHFLEHIYHSVNGGLWGELVWNRSFEISPAGTGLWSLAGNDLVQSSLDQNVRLLFGDTTWRDYEITLEARKDGGNEGFLILFRADGDNFYWANLGGWNNTRHAIEKGVAGGGRWGIVGPTVEGRINTAQWHDIRIRCQGNHFQVWLDEEKNPEPIIDYLDIHGAHLTGQVGLGTWATQARFRNIQIRNTSDSSVLFSGLPVLATDAFSKAFWHVFGPCQASMDTDALNDDLSIEIVSNVGASGIQQDNYKFIKQTYHGSLWMKGSLPAGVRVELLDGTTVLGQATLPGPTASWDVYSFQITPTAATDQGRLKIMLLGAGTVSIDQVSLMGQDAMDTGGYRPDLLQAIAGLRPPIIRWPGGCYASAYFWKDGIGPQHKRKKYPISLWDDQDTNAYGTDEFLRMCEAIGAEPLIVVNSGVLNITCGVPIPHKLTPAEYLQDALDWIQYCNGPSDSPWGSQRAANGHPEPYNVKYWEIDNETWNAGVWHYIDTVLKYAPAMRAADPNIVIIACGSGGYNQNWNRRVIDRCAHVINYISTHLYEQPDNFKQGPRNYESFIEELGAYIKASANPNIKIYMSEWNAQSTDWRTGLYAGGLLNAFERTGYVFEIGGPALFLRHISATGWDNAFINFDHTAWFPAPNYQVMKLWRDHYAPKCVATTGEDKDLNVVSTMTEDEQTLTIRIVNPDPLSKTLAFEIDRSFIPKTATMHYYAPGSLSARNTLTNPNAIQLETKTVDFSGQVLRFTMPAYSAGIVRVRAVQPH